LFWSLTSRQAQSRSNPKADPASRSTGPDPEPKSNAALASPRFRQGAQKSAYRPPRSPTPADEADKTDAFNARHVRQTVVGGTVNRTRCVG
jgi:hypothetical protein